MWLITGCTLWHKNHPVDLEFIPDQYTNDYAVRDTFKALYQINWWKTFEDTLLNRYFDTAFESNYDLAQAAARLDQFKARYRISRSSIFPGISAGSAYQNPDLSNNSESNIPTQTEESYSSNLSMAYEIDFFGKLSTFRGAAYTDLLASQEDLHTFKLVFSGQLARMYFKIMELQQQVILINKTISSLTDYLDLVTSRYNAGLVPSLEVYQAETNLAKIRAAKQKVETAYLTAQNLFFTLLGEYPAHNQNVGAEPIDPVFPKINYEIPSDLLKRRPDIRSSYLRMKSADQLWASAVADRFPSIRFTTQGGALNKEFIRSLNPDNFIWNAIGSVTLPLLEGGRRKAAADRSAAVYRELAAKYKSVVLNSFREVEDALITIEKQRQYLEELTIQATAAENSLRVASDRYLRGLSQYLVLVTAQTAHFNAETQLIAARRELMDAYISLSLSLGGNWNEKDATDRSNNNTKKVESP